MLTNLFHIINYLSVGSSLLLAFLLIANPQKVNKKANLWFGCFILGIFLLLFDDILIATKMKPNNEFLAFIINFPNFIIAPIFYLSISYYINPTQKWKNKHYFHFTFGFFMIALLIVSRFIHPNQNSDETVKKFSEWFVVIFGIVFCLQLIPYFYFSYRKIIKHQKNIRLFASTIENVDLKWLEYMIKGVLVMVVFWIVDILFQLAERSLLYKICCNSIYLLGFFFIGYHSMKQKEIYPYNEDEKDEISEIIIETEIPEENRKKLLPDEKLVTSKITLIHLMESTKPYLDCELNLVKLASLMDVSVHILSYIINTGFGENFYQFINRYRIEEAKKLITNPKMNHFNLIGIAYEVGFNSKTVFNTTFKKYTGKTPTEYKKVA